jgi:hypothetical protein
MTVKRPTLEQQANRLNGGGSFRRGGKFGSQEGSSMEASPWLRRLASRCWITSPHG